MKRHLRIISKINETKFFAASSDYLKNTFIRKSTTYGCGDIKLQVEMVIFWKNWFFCHHGKKIKRK